MNSTTIDRLQSLLARNGYKPQRLNEATLVTPVVTVAYRNPAGQPTAAIFFTINENDSVLTVGVPWAFDGSKALHKDALHRCLLVAAGKIPLVKTQFDPDDGEVCLRVDLPLGPDGFRDDDVIRGVHALQRCVEDWHAPITCAMKSGTFEVPARKLSTLAPPVSAQLSEIARRAGGVNRLKVLFEFGKVLERESSHQKENRDGNHA